MKKLESLQSKAARYVLGRSRKNWSKREGYGELGWVTITRTAVEFSLRMAYKVMWNRKPEILYDSIFDSEENKPRRISQEDLKGMTKLRRKSWKIRVLRYLEKLPEEFLRVDPSSMTFRSSLKSWIKENIEANGDHIFKGKIEEPEMDWLESELEALKYKTAHDLRSEEEALELS